MMMKRWGQSLEVGGMDVCSSPTGKQQQNIMCAGKKRLAFCLRWKIHTCFITNTHTFGCVLHLHSPSLHQTFLCLAVISFTQFSLLSLSPFIPSSCMLGKWKQWGGIRRLNCPLFMWSPRVNKHWSSVKRILHLAVTESVARDAENPWDATQSWIHSFHIFLPFRPKHTRLYSPKQEQDLRKRKGKKNPPFCIVSAFRRF